MDDVRKTYRQLSEGEVEAMNRVKTVGQDFINLLREIGTSSRELSLAKTKIEEAVMWAVKSITS